MSTRVFYRHGGREFDVTAFVQAQPAKFVAKYLRGDTSRNNGATRCKLFLKRSVMPSSARESRQQAKRVYESGCAAAK